MNRLFNELMSLRVRYNRSRKPEDRLWFLILKRAYYARMQEQYPDLPERYLR